MDEELMAGITEIEDSPGHYSAYVLRHTTGETLGVQAFDNLFEAIRTLNDIPREWNFEAVSKCGGKKAAQAAGIEPAGDCSTGSCPI